MSIQFNEKKYFIHFVPLLNLTDAIYRNTLNEFWPGIDMFLAPFVSVTAGSRLKRKSFQDLNPDKNTVTELVPQLLSNNASELILFGKHVNKMGFSELNWNLGCPYPAITRHKRGSGILPFPEQIDAILNSYFNESDVAPLSVKMRLGKDYSNELSEVIPVLKKYNLNSVTLHVRTALGMYTAPVRPDFIKLLLRDIVSPVFYNGDVDSYMSFKDTISSYPSLNGIAVGRGFLKRPWLMDEIKQNREIPFAEVKDLFWSFHDSLLLQYSQVFPNNSSMLGRFKELWSYFRYVTPTYFLEYDKMKRLRDWESWQEMIEILKRKEFF